MNLEHLRPIAEGIISFVDADVFYGTLIALTIAVALWALPNIAPHLRYRIVFVGLCVTMAMSIAAAVRSSIAMAPPQLPQGSDGIFATTLSRSAPARTAQSMAIPASSQASRQDAYTIAMPLPTAVFLLAVWSLMVCGSLVRLGLGLLSSSALLQRAKPVSPRLEEAVRQKAKSHVRRPFTVLVTDDCAVPLAIGLFASAILIPRQTLEDFSEDDVEQIVLHELGHLQRWDDFGYLFQLVSQAFSLVSPGVYWLCWRMELEREMACDRWAIDFGGSARRYAWCLAKMARCVGDSALAPAALSRPSTTIRRIRQLTARPNYRPSLRSPVAAVAVLLAILELVRVNPVPALAVEHSEKARAMSSRDYIQDLRRLGYHNLSASEIVNLKITGIQPEYARAVQATGIHPTVKDLMYLFTAPASPGYVAGVHGAIPGATASDIALLASLRVPVSYVKGVADVKPSAADAPDIVRFRDLGVTIQFLASLSALGYAHLVPEQVAALRTVGVDAAFIQRANGKAMRRLSAEDLVRERYASK